MSGTTPLNIAAYRGHIDVVRLLLQQPNIDITIADEDGTPKQSAQKRGHTEIVKLLKEARIFSFVLHI